MKPVSGSRDPRRIAVEILDRVERAGAYASILLEERAPAISDSRDVGMLYELVLGVLRRRLSLDSAIARVSSRPLAEIDSALLTPLRVGMYALLYLDRVPPFAAVNSTVDLVRGKPQRGFVNGVLREVLRSETPLLPEEPREGDLDGLVVWGSHPRALVTRWLEQIGWERTYAMLEANNSTPRPMLHIDPRSDLQIQLEQASRAGLELEPATYAPFGQRIVAGSLARSGFLQEHRGWVQDEAAQLVAQLLGSAPLSSVLDLCAAPGGKTFQVATRPEAPKVLAVDRHAGRLRTLKRQANWLGLTVKTLEADGTAASELGDESFDAVLVDAPCSGSGTLRRHPEIRWRLDLCQQPALVATQRKLLASAAARVRPGGQLLYSVCSIEPEEGAAQREWFRNEFPGWVEPDLEGLLPESSHRWIQDGALATFPGPEEMDGFYAFRVDRPLEPA